MRKGGKVEKNKIEYNLIIIFNFITNKYLIMNRRVMNSSYNAFEESLNGSEIEEYFGMNDKNKTEKIHFDIMRNSNNNVMIFYIDYYKKNLYNFQNLPIEINSMIASYTQEYIRIALKIVFTSEYPFRAPIWSLMNVRHNMNTPLNLTEYYEYIVDNHNTQHWSPVTRIEKDVLDFIRKINHFEYLHLL